MGCCPAIGCNNRSGKNKPPGITFHRFPSNPVKRKIWIKALQRKDWEPNLTTCLCSAHFKEEEIDRSANLVRIRDGAVPSVFPTLLSERVSRKRRSSDSDSPQHQSARISLAETCENSCMKKLQKGLSKIKPTSNIKRKDAKRNCNASRSSVAFTCNNGICEPLILSDQHMTPIERSTSNTEVQGTCTKTEALVDEGPKSCPEYHNLDAESSSTATCLSTRANAHDKLPYENKMTPKNVDTSLPRKKTSKSEVSEPFTKLSSKNVMAEIDGHGSKKKCSIDHKFSVPSTSEAEMHQSSKLTDGHKESRVEKTLKTQLQRKEERIKSLKKKIRLLQQTTRRMTRRVTNLKEVVNDMKTKLRSQQEANSSLGGFSGASLFLVKRQMIKMEGGKLQRIYNEKLKDFALTLNFISPPAYDYVRRVFGDCLPHRKTICKWILKNKKQLMKDSTVGGDHRVADMFEAHGTLGEQCAIGDVGLVGAPGCVRVEVARTDPEVSAAVLGIQLGDDERTLISL